MAEIREHAEDQQREGALTTADLAQAADRPAMNFAEERPAEGPTPLFAEDEATDLRRQWDAIQTGFVDEPRRAVESADTLVAATMKRLAEMFAAERAQLESQWDRGDDVSTEDLRIALQRYRGFFGRLLSI